MRRLHLRTYRTNHAFTLVELMVVVAIIALLTGIIMTNLTSSRAKTRDGKRISDIGQLQLSLALYYDRCKQFPSTLATSTANGCPSGSSITLGSYMSAIPTPPDSTSANPKSYDYLVVPTTYTDFVLHTKLEAQNDNLQKDSLQSIPSGIPTPSWTPAACYNSATSPLEYCLGSK